jgi:hypothetical protein
LSLDPGVEEDSVGLFVDSDGAVVEDSVGLFVDSDGAVGEGVFPLEEAAGDSWTAFPTEKSVDLEKPKLPPPDTKVFESLPLLSTSTTLYFPVDPRPSPKPPLSSMVKA